MGGKSAVEIAEERLKKEQQDLHSAVGYSASSGGSGYQGIQIANLEENVQVTKPTNTMWGGSGPTQPTPQK